ncbi:hypothetical protein JH25_00220 [Pseudomonas sp. BRG-100]|nr:hypothetical protein JH25_00220 [Pseudomonas sp. BRG-100]
MARKRKGANVGLGTLFPLVILVGLFAQIPKPVWIVLSVGIAIGCICWLIFKPRKRNLTSSPVRDRIINRELLKYSPEICAQHQTTC